MTDKTEGTDPLLAFDQTNGLAQGLEGDDDGALVPEDPRVTIGEIVERIVPDSLRKTTDLPSGETPYSEEGRA